MIADRYLQQRYEAGRQAERDRIKKVLDELGDKLTPEQRDLILGNFDPKKE